MDALVALSVSLLTVMRAFNKTDPHTAAYTDLSSDGIFLIIMARCENEPVTGALHIWVHSGKPLNSEGVQQTEE